jgi:penicillin-binding protein 1A
VSNYGEGSAGVVDLTEATVHSYNTVFAQLIMRVGPARAMEAAERFGITSPLKPVPAAVLGANNVTALDMASVYGTFANRGVHVPPVLVTKITNPDGTVLYQNEHHQERVLDAAIADQLTAVLEQVILRGTGTRANIGRPAAGKTGTAQEWKDAWFAGYTPDLATAVWIGFPKREISMTPPNTRVRVTGGMWPAMIWQRFMSAALDGVRPSSFHPPATTTTSAPAAAQTTIHAPAVDGEVPSVVGLPIAEAKAVLSSNGFKVREETVAAGARTPGTVAAQSPVGGTAAPRGSTVIVEVTSGH